MSPITRRLARAGVLGALLLSAAASSPQPPAPGPQTPSPAPQAAVITSCSIVPPRDVRGFVTNGTASDFSVVGVVRFQFPEASAPAPAVEAHANVRVPAGRTVMAAQTTAPFAPAPGAPCVFVIDGAVKGISP